MLPSGSAVTVTGPPELDELDELELDELDELELDELDELELDALDELELDALDELELDELDDPELDDPELDDAELDALLEPPPAPAPPPLPPLVSPSVSLKSSGATRAPQPADANSPTARSAPPYAAKTVAPLNVNAERLATPAAGTLYKRLFLVITRLLEETFRHPTRIVRGAARPRGDSGS